MYAATCGGGGWAHRSWILGVVIATGGCSDSPVMPPPDEITSWICGAHNLITFCLANQLVEQQIALVRFLSYVYGFKLLLGLCYNLHSIPA